MNNKNIILGILFFFLLAAISALIFVSFRASRPVAEKSQHGHSTAAKMDNGCDGKIIAKQILIRNGEFMPSEVIVDRCTIVEFRNFDKVERHPALGEHDNHTEYPGFAEATLKPGQHNGFVAAQSGKYLIHDHLDEKLQDEITVK